MTDLDIEPPRPASRRPASIAVIVAVVLLGTLFGLATALSRRTVRVTLINHGKTALRQIRVDYSGGSLTLPDMSVGGYGGVEFRPRRPITSADPGLYEITVRCETADGIPLVAKTRVDRFAFRAERVYAVEVLSNGKIALISHSPRSAVPSRVVAPFGHR